MKYPVVISVLVVVVAGAGVYALTRRTVEMSSSRADEPTASVSVTPSVVPVKAKATSKPVPTVAATKTPTPTPGGTTFTLSQVASHNSQSSCYSVIYGAVYDLTSYIPKHPGGPRRILEICGKDGTSLFDDQHGGGQKQAAILASLKIGTVVQ